MDKFNGFTLDQWNKVKFKVLSKDSFYTQENILITEKLRRFCSFYGKNLAKESKKRFKKKAIFNLENIMDILLFCASKNNVNFSSKNLPIDQAYLNAAFYCSDALSKLNSSKSYLFNVELEKLLKELRNYLLKNKKNEIKQENLYFDLLIDFDKFSNYKNRSSVIIFSSGLYCPISICLIEICSLLNIPIKGLVIKNRNTFFSFVKNNLKQIFRLFSFLSRDNFYAQPKQYFSIQRLSKVLSPRSNNIIELANKKNIPFLRVNKFDEANQFLKENNSSIGFFAGGGIISKSTIDCFTIGIINAHKGYLPLYKGMHVAQAALVEGRFDLIGITSHLIEKGIDTGPIINFYKVSPFEYKSINTLKKEMSAIIPFLIVGSYINLISGNFTPSEQEKIGRQYYSMHKIVKNIVSYTFKSNFEISKKTTISKYICELLIKLGY